MGLVHKRRSIRLKAFDYSEAGAYFVTVSTHQRQCLLGEVIDGRVQLTAWGGIVAKCWHAIQEHFPEVEPDAFVVMPNHVHGILIIAPTAPVAAGARHASPLRARGVQPKSLGAVIGSFKSSSPKDIRRLQADPEVGVWQRNYYEHVVRNEASLNRIREYIATNPARWELDRENMRAGGKDEFDSWLATFKRRPKK
jgi:REP element-mobilizing transposase RayT